MKEYVAGIASAFAVLAAYKIIQNKKKQGSPSINNDIWSEDYPEQSPVYVPHELSFDAKDIEDREKITFPSGFVIASTDAEKNISYFQKEITNVYENTDEKIIIYDIDGTYKEFAKSLNANIIDIRADDCTNESLREYIDSKYEDNNDYEVSPLNDRITYFNQAETDKSEKVLESIFIKASETPRTERLFIRLYIVNSKISQLYEATLDDILKKCRMRGVIVSALIDPDMFLKSESLKSFYLFTGGYTVLTDNVEDYSNSDSLCGILNGCKNIYIAPPIKPCHNP